MNPKYIRQMEEGGGGVTPLIIDVRLRLFPVVLCECPVCDLRPYDLPN